ncbi:MAG: DUF1850 domain-containing protein [Planctomycetaceae bacterium]
MRKRVIFFLLLLAGLVFFASQHSFWILSLGSGNKILWFRPVEPGDSFQLRYLHSIALSDVWEIFQIDSGHRIVLTETRFQGQGAGLPYNLAPGERLSREGRWFRISGMKRGVPSISWTVQKEWRDRFRFQEEPEINFSSLVGDRLILIQVQKINLIQWFRLRFLQRGNHA